MPDTDVVYTYRGGRKLVLNKEPDQFVVRAAPDRLHELGIAHTERVSPGSTRVDVPPDQLEAMMADARAMAPTHHAYAMSDTGQEFLITDRVLVTFKEPLSAERVAEFAGRYGLLQLEAYSDRDFLFQVTEHTGVNPIKLVVKLTESEPIVANAENDVNYRVKKQLSIPSDPAYARQWHLHNHFNHPAVDPRANARCEGAWQMLDNFGSHDVVIGLTDDGCKLDHPDFDSPEKF